MDDVVALALGHQQSGRREDAQLLRSAGVGEADQRRELLCAARVLGEKLEDLRS
jgi:hypothetical protein